MRNYIFFIIFSCSIFTGYASDLDFTIDKKTGVRRTDDVNRLTELSYLPLSNILSFLEAKDAVKLSETCKFFYDKIQSKNSWYKTTQNNLIFIIAKYDSTHNTNKFDKIMQSPNALRTFVRGIYPIDTTFDFTKVKGSKHMEVIKFNPYSLLNGEMQYQTYKNFSLKDKNLGELGGVFPKIKWLDDYNCLKVDLTNTNLGDLGKYFEKATLPNTPELLMNTNNLHKLGEHFISIQNKLGSKIRSLHLSDNNLGALGKYFYDVNWKSTLQELYLDNNNLYILGDNILKCNFPLFCKKIYLRENNINFEIQKKIKEEMVIRLSSRVIKSREEKTGKITEKDKEEIIEKAIKMYNDRVIFN